MRTALLLAIGVLVALTPLTSTGTAPGTISTIVGSGASGGCLAGPATASPLRSPRDVATDPDGNLFIADAADNRICFVNMGDAPVTLFGVTVAPGDIAPVIGSGIAGFCGDDGPAATACLNEPGGIEVDSVGNVYIADRGNNRVRIANRGSTSLVRHGQTIAAGAIKTVAGNGSAGYCGDSGPATLVCLPAPADIALDSNGVLYIADPPSSRILTVGASGWLLRYAGGGYGFCGDGGDAGNACINQPDGVAIDAADNVYIADTANHRVRRVDRATHIITTYAGNGIELTCGDGSPATTACVAAPRRLAVDALGNLLISSTENSVARWVAFDTRIIYTAAGTETCGFSGDGGGAGAAALCGNIGVDYDAVCNLYIADTGNRRVRRIEPYDMDTDGLTDCAELAYGTNRLNPDSDADGLSDGNEVYVYGSDPIRTDTDADGLGDGAEVMNYGTSPVLADSDADALTDGAEANTYHTDPLVADTDGDGLSDGGEVNTFGTNPLKRDTDGDGLNDGFEVAVAHTDPLVADTDADGLGDGAEVNVHHTDPLVADTDADGLGDGAEVMNYGTSPVLADSDADALTDGAEVNTYHTNPLVADTDGDTLNDGAEVETYGTSPTQADTDGDGFLDPPSTSFAPVNTDTSRDNCPTIANPEQRNSDGELIPAGRALRSDLTNPLADALGDGCDPDRDNDGLVDAAEGPFPVPGCPSATGPTDPGNPDTDGDGSLDGVECSRATDPASARSKPAFDPRCVDADGDGVPDQIEARGWGTSSASLDTDGDGLTDGEEIADVDGNRVVTFGDALVIARATALAGPFAPGPLTAEERHAFDLDRNGVVTFADAIFVARRVAGLLACS